MTYLLVLAGLVLLPLLAIMVMRVNGAVAFMSLCLGSVLVTYTSADVADLITSFTRHGTLSVMQWVQLALLLLSFLLALLFARHSIGGRRKFTNILPALAAGLLFALLVVPLLPADLGREIQHTEAWHQLSSLQTFVVLGGAAFSLLFIRATHHGHGDDEKH